MIGTIMTGTIMTGTIMIGTIMIGTIMIGTIMIGFAFGRVRCQLRSCGDWWGVIQLSKLVG